MRFLCITFFIIFLIADSLDLRGAPSWIYQKDKLYGAVGSAYIVDSDVSGAIIEASASARAKIAYQIAINSKEINPNTQEELEEKICKIIEGSRSDKMWITKDGKTLYAWVEISDDMINKVHQLFEDKGERGE
ncbi:hypothetical protein [Helicobacter brantae]|uniref:Uncharacterized protein n=1 Tax=Helicobacter brantae TaxID=375927 RepID=A0A3D8J2N4_9HELI|nr:hypothetical protein [Helicobacter brantae]RDU71405.1 hypothetical protein CQA58_02340 [Helicobacter brantae]